MADSGENTVMLGLCLHYGSPVLTVHGDTSVETGDDDDLIQILDSFFAGAVEIDGGDDDDTFEDLGGNTFGDGIDLVDIETVLP